MSKYVKIITNDARFCRLLELELNGINVETVDSIEKLQSDAEIYVLADLDLCLEEELNEFKDKTTVIGFSKDERIGDSPKYLFCSSVFVRPFQMSDLLALFGYEGRTVVIERKQKNQEHYKKVHFLSVDPAEKLALWGDKKIPLSDNEYKLLNLLCENRGEVVGREKIYSLLGAEEGNMGDVYICHLRRKIDNKLGLKLIYTIRGKGYMLKN